MTFILKPGDPGVLGGKAAALARLHDAGFDIPAWFVVAPAAFHASHGKGAPLDSLQPSAEASSQLAAALAELGSPDDRFAVRSSAVDEDGGAHSFAGQLESYLFVAPADVAARVADVWRSGFSERVMTYRKEAGLGDPEPPAVLVQRMVAADAAGVAFGVDPVSGRWDRALVSGVFGLGTALVGGDADADTWSVDRAGAIHDRAVATKAFAHRFDPGSVEGVGPQALPPELAAQPCLEDGPVARVADLARRCGRAFGRPQDIEWAFEGEHLWLLQSRPITTLGQVPDPGGLPALWDNSNIAESYGGVTTPLTYAFARRAYEEVYRQFSRMMGVDEARIEAHTGTFRGMIGLVRGRVYYNLLAWYRVLALLPGFQLNRGFMEQMMGVKEGLPAAFLAEFDAKPSFGEKLLDALRLTRSLAGLLRNHWTLETQIEDFYTRLNEALAPPALPLADQRPDELAAHYRDLEARLLTRWDAPLVNDFFAMIFYGVLKALCAKWCGDADGTLQNDLVGGEGGIISAEPAARVRRMAELAREDAALAALLREGEVPAIRAAVAKHPHLDSEVWGYLQLFGDRCLEELKLESPTLDDDPLTLFRAIGHFAARGATGHEGHSEKARAAAEAAVVKRLRFRPLRRLLFGWALKQARDRVRDRENLRFERTRLFGRVRRIFVELGRRFHAVGLLEDPRDVFHLEVEEILGFIEGTSTSDALAGLAAVRKAAFAGYHAGPAPADRFATFGWVGVGQRLEGDAKVEVDPGGDERKGLGCCPGRVRGPVRVVRDPRGVELPAGTILVAERTDPGWIMLFPAASGLLVERGSLLSHSAIVSRELGLPAIVSIPGITTWLADGDWVEFDGASGVVRKLEGPDAQ
jgi:pyruvate,water dikinase